jgi:hypothetical protein
MRAKWPNERVTAEFLAESSTRNGCVNHRLRLSDLDDSVAVMGWVESGELSCCGLFQERHGLAGGYCPTVTGRLTGQEPQKEVSSLARLG